MNERCKNDYFEGVRLMDLAQTKTKNTQSTIFTYITNLD